MVNTFTGNISAKGQKFGLIVSRFNEVVTGKLLSGALDCIDRHDGDMKNVDVFWVPGSFEIPSMTQKLAATGKYNAIICLGAVIRGETPHFDYIAAEVTKGVAQVGLTSKMPVSYGVLTTDTVEQAIDRAGAKVGNKGWDAALSAMEMVDLYRQVKK